MSDPQLYTIGWICAITTEYTAACQFLDKEHSLPTRVAANDSNGYTLGEMAGHNVVIAVLPRGEYGLSSAASVAANMLNSFPNLRVGLMVGIGGGAPTSKNDIRLGDIVVSSPKDQTGGVYQYDFGKTIQGRKFQPTASLNQPPAVVLTAMSVLESRYEAEGHHIEEDIAAVFKRRPKLTKRYSRPNQLSDRLYRSHAIHPHDEEGDYDLYQSHKEGARQPNLDSLSRTLNVMISQMDEVTIVLDALDESRTRKELLVWLEGIRETQDINLRLLATSRKEEDIYSHIGKWCSTDEILAIPDDAMDKDIQAYVHASIQTDRRFDRWESRPDVQEEIETKLMEKAGGMFRWAKCQLDTLEHCFDYPDVEKTLRELPKDLYGTYARILEQILEQNVPKVVRVLQLLTWSERPLLLEEMVDAIAVRPNDEPAFNPLNRMPRPRDILRICPSLVLLVDKSASEDSILEHVTYDSQGSDEGSDSGAAKVWELRLAHFSVKEYLVSKDVQHPVMGQLEETSARAAIAITCLAYLSSLDHNLSLGQIRQQYAFSQYSAMHWAENAKVGGGTDKELQSRITAFMSEAEMAFPTCHALFNPEFPWETEPDSTREKVLTPLYYASMTGLEMSTKSLVCRGADVNAQGGYYGSALQAASVRGHDKIVQMLLDEGADVNA
ncbi:Pfs, NACHT and ankyrin domain protein [Aureobasidium pullulans]|nr:Pfs, NACHT and ankyrin domain protein [Aureobasidium pullulans]